MMWPTRQPAGGAGRLWPTRLVCGYVLAMPCGFVR